MAKRSERLERGQAGWVGSGRHAVWSQSIGIGQASAGLGLDGITIAQLDTSASQVPPPPQTWRDGPPASIPATEHRGITIAQLETIVDAINQHADAEGFLPGWTDINGKTCRKDTINLYPLCVRIRR